MWDRLQWWGLKNRPLKRRREPLMAVGLFGCSPWQTLSRVLLWPPAGLPLRAVRTWVLLLKNLRTLVLSFRFTVWVSMAMGTPWPPLTCIQNILEELALHLS